MTGEEWQRRRDLERQLHDGPALQIAALSLRLGLLAESDGDLRAEVQRLQGRLHVVLQELRAIADQIYPPLLQEAGLAPAVRELAASVGVPVRVAAGPGRFGTAAEGAAYFAVLELLDRLGAGTRTVDVTVRREDGGLALDLANVDTDRGVAAGDRIRWLGGSVEVPAAGTIRVRIPCE